MKYHVYTNVELIENQNIDDCFSMCMYKFRSIQNSKYWNDESVHIIEDTIVDFPNDVNKFGRKVGTFIRNEGMEKVINFLQLKGKVKIISNVLYYKDYKYGFISSEMDGFFIWDDKNASKSSIEDYFYIQRNDCLEKIMIDDYPRVQNFKKLRNALFV